MENEQSQIEQLNAVISGLKIRTFDAEEGLKAERAQTNQFMQQLVNTARVLGDDKGVVTLDSILDRVSKLVAIEEDGTTPEAEAAVPEFEEITA